MSAFPQQTMSAASDFYNFIHPTKRLETVVLWDKTKQKGAWTCVDPMQDITAHLDSMDGKTDIYYSPNEFYKWRLNKNLRRLTSFYVDVDCRDLDNRSKSDYNDYIINILQDTLNKIDNLNISMPNCVVYTGRGFHLYWRFEPVGAKCLPRWKAAMRQLVDIIDNADPACTDATRMMRLPNTYNSKNGTLSEVGFLSGENYHFDDLCDEILPHSRSEIRDFRAARAKRGLTINKRKNEKSGTFGSIYERWYLVYQDIHKLITHYFNKNNNKSVPQGMRDRLLFHAANAMSWFTHKEALESEIRDLAARYFGSLDLSKAMGYCSSVISRARNTDNSESGKGELRYKYKSETLYDELKDLIPNELIDQMRALVSPEAARHKKAEKQRVYRQQRGAVSRSEYLAAIEKRRKRAEALFKKGMSKKTIAETLKISLSTVKNYLKAAAKNVSKQSDSKGSRCVPLYSGRSPELFVSVSSPCVIWSLLCAVCRPLLLKKLIKKTACPAGQRCKHSFNSS